METGAAAIGQSSFDFLWWLCLVILVGLFIAAVWLLFWLGKLPGGTRMPAAIRKPPRSRSAAGLGCYSPRSGPLRWSGPIPTRKAASLSPRPTSRAWRLRCRPPPRAWRPLSGSSERQARHDPRYHRLPDGRAGCS